MTAHYFFQTGKSIMVLGIFQAIELKPYPNSLIIRIVDGAFQDFPPLKYEKDFAKILIYGFDDIDSVKFPNIKKDLLGNELVLFNTDIAKKILSETQDIKNFDHVIVHCAGGISRSPAVAIALNEIYDLGFDTDNMKQTWQHYNKFVYGTMIATTVI